MGLGKVEWVGKPALECSVEKKINYNYILLLVLLVFLIHCSAWSVGILDTLLYSKLHDFVYSF